MKRVVLFFLILIIGLPLISCSFGGAMGIFDNDQTKINAKFEELLEAMQSKNAEDVEKLFSKNTLMFVKNFNDSIQQLFDYFDGEVISYDYTGAYVGTSKEDGEIFQEMEESYEVKTTQGDYRIALRYISRDTENADNVGIEFIYIMKKAEDVNLEYRYAGDGKKTPGIHVDIKNDYCTKYLN